MKKKAVSKKKISKLNFTKISTLNDPHSIKAGNNVSGTILPTTGPMV